MWTALHYAANEGHGDILEKLIEMNISVEAVTNRMRTALHLSCARGHVDISRLLCDQVGIDKNALDADGNTPLHLASQQGQVDTIKFLLGEAPPADSSIKNAAGFLAYDIAYNSEVQNLLNAMLVEMWGHDSARNLEESKNQYGRRAIDGVLLHNDRVSKVTNLMHKFGQLEKHMKH